MIAYVAVVATAILAVLVSPATHVGAGITATVFPLETNSTVCLLAGGIATGQDGALWVAEFYSDANKVARMTTTGQVSEFPMPLPFTMPQHIVAGPDGALWFTEGGATRIGRITTAGAITEYAIPSGGASGIAVGPDGALWFTERYVSKVGRVTTTGVVTEYALPVTMEPEPITTGPDGNLWFFDDRASAVVKFTTAGVATAYPVAQQDIGMAITTGPDGNLWSTLRNTPGVGRMTTIGAYTFFPLARGRIPGDIVRGPDGNLWFPEEPNGVVARLTPAGVLTEYAVPIQTPGSMTVGPDGNLWTTEFQCDPLVARVIPNRGPSPSITSAIAFDAPHTLTLTGTDPDDPPSALRYAIVSGPVHGTITDFSSTGTLIYAAPIGYTGTDSFVYTVTDGEKTSAPTTLTLTIQPAVPNIAGIDPSQVTAAGQAIQIAGDNFQPGATVLIGTSPAAHVTVVNSRTITATAPEHGTGAVTVTVRNPNGQSGFVDGALSYAYTAPQGRSAGTAGGSPIVPPSRPGTSDGGSPGALPSSR
jgi:streptogramin lyase